MKNYGKQYSSISPLPIEITQTAIFIASNIEKVQREIGDHIVEEYEYDLMQYDKDEYIIKLSDDNNALQQQVLDTQLALCDIYESLEEGEV